MGLGFCFTQSEKLWDPWKSYSDCREQLSVSCIAGGMWWSKDELLPLPDVVNRLRVISGSKINTVDWAIVFQRVTQE